MTFSYTCKCTLVISVTLSCPFPLPLIPFLFPTISLLFLWLVYDSSSFIRVAHRNMGTLPLATPLEKKVSLFLPSILTKSSGKESGGHNGCLVITSGDSV